MNQGFAVLAAALLVLTGCAGGQTVDSDRSAGAGRYSSFLVIGQAPRYSTRADFERMVVSGIRDRGADATAHHVAAGGDLPITRESLRELVSAGGYDAVLVTRVLDSDTAAEIRTQQSETLAARRDQGFLKLFRYDYREVVGASAIDLNVAVTLETDVFDGGSEALVWSNQTTTPEFQTIAELIDNAARTVTRRVARAGLIDN